MSFRFLPTLMFFAACSYSEAVPTANVGESAPAFSLSDLDGNTVNLNDLRGKTVVLEWFNPGCPFVVSAHEDGPLQSMAQQAAADGITWLAINSSAAGKQGHGSDVNREAAKKWKMEHPILLDANGKVGRQYGAVTTPQMFIIDAAGTLQYAGALDNAPRGQVPASGLVNHVKNGLRDLAEGTPVKTARSKPYGCSVKY